TIGGPCSFMPMLPAAATVCAPRHRGRHEELSMAEYSVEALWQRGTQDFLDHRYSRRHLLRFEGGLAIPGSSSPHVVPIPMSDATALDPEEAFVSALCSCHMLWF